MARYAASCNRVLPAHNLPVVQPSMVIAAAKDFEQIASGKRNGKPAEDNCLSFDCGKFSYLIGSSFIQQLSADKNQK